MNMKLIMVAICCFATIGCNRIKDKVQTEEFVVTKSPAKVVERPYFKVGINNRISNRIFSIAESHGLIDGQAGGLVGTIEEKWGVDISLEHVDYNRLIARYGGGYFDAAAMTNVDAMNLSRWRQTTVILPLSTSVGGDKVVSIKPDLESLKGARIFGQADSVSQYLLARALRKNGISEQGIKLQNLGAEPASMSFLTQANNIDAVVVWSPFTLDAMRLPDSKVLFDSAQIPEEIIDVFVVGRDIVNKEAGVALSNCLCDIFYTTCQKMESGNSKTTLKSLSGEQRLPTAETRFCNKPESGIALFNDPAFQALADELKSHCSDAFGASIESVGFGDDKAELNFDVRFMQNVTPK